MKYYIKQSVFSLTDRFTIKDQYGVDVYTVEGSFFKIPKEFTIYNMDGRPVVFIKKQLFRFMSHFDIEIAGHHVTVKQNFTFFRRSISMENIQWTLEGDLWGYNYSLVEGNRYIMSLKKHWFTWGDSYELDIENENEAPLCIAIAIVIDRLIYESNSSSSNSSN